MTRRRRPAPHGRAALAALATVGGNNLWVVGAVLLFITATAFFVGCALNDILLATGTIESLCSQQRGQPRSSTPCAVNPSISSGRRRGIAFE